MTPLRFALGAVGCVLLPVAVAGAIAGVVYDRLIAPNHDQLGDDIVDAFQAWHTQETTA